MKYDLKHIAGFMAGVLLAASTVGCRADYDQLEGQAVAYRFEGSVLDYLSQPDDDLGFSYEMMMTVIDGIPGFRDKIDAPDGVYTIFAIPDECFASALTSLNNYRSSLSLGDPVSLSDLLVEPFDVLLETVEVDGVPTDIYAHYDYRQQMAELLGRYVFTGQFDSAFIDMSFGGIGLSGLEDGYGMNVVSERASASGLREQGARRIMLSDMNGSQSKTKWVTSTTKRIDIYADNGVVHVLAPGHEFGFDKFLNLFYNRYNEDN